MACDVLNIELGTTWPFGTCTPPTVVQMSRVGEMKGQHSRHCGWMEFVLLFCSIEAIHMVFWLKIYTPSNSWEIHGDVALWNDWSPMFHNCRTNLQMSWSHYRHVPRRTACSSVTYASCDASVHLLHSSNAFI